MIEQTQRAYSLVTLRPRRHLLAMAIAAGVVGQHDLEGAMNQLLIHAGMLNAEAATVDMRALLEKLRADYAAHEDEPPTLDEAKAVIDRMSARDRAMLAPWLLATFDHAGVRNRGYPSENEPR